MISPQQFEIPVDIYGRYILVCINEEDEEDEEVKRILLESGYSEKKSSKVSSYWPVGIGAFTHVFKNRNCLMRFKIDNIDPEFHEQVAHEIFHCAAGILDYIGIPLGSKSEEAYAYLIGYITRQFYENLKN